MIHLKRFENIEENWDIDKEDIKEIFNDFIDEFEIIITFGKKLQQYNLATGPDIKFRFKNFIKVNLIPLEDINQYKLSEFFNSDYFSERISEILSKLGYHDLELFKAYVEINSIIFLIYTKK